MVNMDVPLCEFDRILGDKVRRLRILSGMKQQEVADILGVSFQQVQKYEKGINRITVKTLYVLTKCMNVSFNEILAGIWHEDLGADKGNQQRVDIMRAFNQLSREQAALLLQIIAAFDYVNSRVRHLEEI